MSHQVPENGRLKTGTYLPEDMHEVPTKANPALCAEWEQITGLAATISDILDELGYHLAVPSHMIHGVQKNQRVVGRVVTLRYLPERQQVHTAPGRLAHKAAMNLAEAGDVLVIEGDHTASYSVLGGLGAEHAKERGIRGVLVDGAVRDVDQIGGMGIPVWARGTTAISGKHRLVGVGINVAILFGDIQVSPGDIAVADDSGICFVPAELADVVNERLKEIVREEGQQGNTP